MRFFPDMGGCERKIAWICQDFRVTDERAPCPQTRRGCHPEDFALARIIVYGALTIAEPLHA